MLRFSHLGLLLFLFVLAVPAAAQPSSSPRNRVNSGFERSAPGIGKPLPDISIYDAQGKIFKLASLRENYSVIVFGCLT
ncbi:MAG: hypothetical protein OER86_05570 [Phycisphaerae bacterium]|nr:hypothetical protein [Phycisphaerae bacterium]